MKIAVPLTDRDFEKRAQLCKQKGAHIVELRVDMFENKSPEKVLDCINFAHSIGLETLLTVRAEDQGGSYVERREEILLSCSPVSDYTDVELSAKDIIPKVRQVIKSAGKKLVLSYHDFERTPAEWVLREIIREGYRWGADIVKVAVKANSYRDVATLLCVGKEELGDKILIAMGSYGKVSRLCGYIFGSVITYSFLDSAVAEGQIPLEDVVNLVKLFYE